MQFIFFHIFTFQIHFVVVFVDELKCHYRVHTDVASTIAFHRTMGLDIGILAAIAILLVCVCCEPGASFVIILCFDPDGQIGVGAAYISQNSPHNVAAQEAQEEDLQIQRNKTKKGKKRIEKESSC